VVANRCHCSPEFMDFESERDFSTIRTAYEKGLGNIDNIECLVQVINEVKQNFKRSKYLELLLTFA